MRELKFRAYTDMRMVPNVPLGSDGKVPAAHTSRDWPVMQYTGLKDKNGKEIYHKDIMKSHKGIIFIVEWSKRKARFYVRTKNIWSGGERRWFKKSIEWAVAHCEIIGNIHQNPELL